MGLVLKDASNKGFEQLPLIRVNYAVAAVLGFVATVLTGSTAMGTQTVVLGAITGTLFVAGLLCWGAAIRSAGLALSVVTMRTAVMLPVLAALVVWRERVNVLQISGIGFAVLALALVLAEVMHERGPLPRPRSAPFWLVGLFLVDGLVMIPAQVFSKRVPVEENLPFQTTIFIVAFLLTSVLYYLRRERVSYQTFSQGALLGVCNLGNYLFLVLALGLLPGVVVYPVIGAAEATLSALAGVVVWRERLGLRGWLGLGLALLALMLVNLGRVSPSG